MSEAENTARLGMGRGCVLSERVRAGLYLRALASLGRALRSQAGSLRRRPLFPVSPSPRSFRPT